MLSNFSVIDLIPRDSLIDLDSDEINIFDKENNKMKH